jgi:hypothetical protein
LTNNSRLYYQLQLVHHRVKKVAMHAPDECGSIDYCEIHDGKPRLKDDSEIMGLLSEPEPASALTVLAGVGSLYVFMCRPERTAWECMAYVATAEIGTCRGNEGPDEEY